MAETRNQSHIEEIMTEIRIWHKNLMATKVTGSRKESNVHLCTMCGENDAYAETGCYITDYYKGMEACSCHKPILETITDYGKDTEKIEDAERRLVQFKENTLEPITLRLASSIALAQWSLGHRYEYDYSFVSKSIGEAEERLTSPETPSNKKTEIISDLVYLRKFVLWPINKFHIGEGGPGNYRLIWAHYGKERVSYPNHLIRQATYYPAMSEDEKRIKRILRETKKRESDKAVRRLARRGLHVRGDFP